MCMESVYPSVQISMQMSDVHVCKESRIDLGVIFNLSTFLPEMGSLTKHKAYHFGQTNWLSSSRIPT